MNPNTKGDLLDDSEQIKTLVLSGARVKIPLNLLNITDESLDDYTIECGYGAYMYVHSTKVNNPEYTQAKLQICRFVLNEKGDIIDCDNIYDQDLLIHFLFIAKNSPFFEHYITKNCGDKLGDSSAILKNVKARYQEVMDKAKVEIEKEKRVYERALSFQSNFKGRTSLDITNDVEVLSVGQAEIGKIDQTTPERYIETVGAGPCIILVGYNRNTQKVIVSHIDASCSPQDTLFLIYRLLGLQSETEFHILGGDNSSIKALVEVNEWLVKNSVNPITFDVLNTTKSIIIDKLTGAIYNTVTGHNRRPDKDPFTLRLRIENRAMEVMFKGKKLLPKWN